MSSLTLVELLAEASLLPADACGGATAVLVPAVEVLAALLGPVEGIEDALSPALEVWVLVCATADATAVSAADELFDAAVEVGLLVAVFEMPVAVDDVLVLEALLAVLLAISAALRPPVAPVVMLCPLVEGS